MIALLLALTAALAQDASCPTTDVWPDEDWEDAPVAPAPDAIAALDHYLFPPDLDRASKDREGRRTDGLLVLHRGRVLHERYGGGYDRDTRHLIWSGTKSFTNNLIGIAVRDGRLSLDDAVCDHYPTANPDACAVTVQHLLEFSSGFDWRETYEGVSPRASSVLAMLYGEGKRDMAAFVGGHPLRDPPGDTYAYSSGDTVLLSAVLGAVLEPEHGERFPFTLLLDRLGMSSARFERDNAGTYVGSSYLYATPRDLARAGYFWLNDGCWNGERVLPAGWMTASTQVSEAVRTGPVEPLDGGVQGRQFWLNRPVPEQGLDAPPWGAVAGETAFAARGHWSQSIVVLPDHDLVVVRTADDRTQALNYARMLELAIALIPEASR